jgi:hypothetical protein
MTGTVPEVHQLMDPADFRKQQSKRPLLAYEIISANDQWSVAQRLTLEEKQRKGWSVRLNDQSRYIGLRPPISWDHVADTNRSWSFHLHSWDPWGPFLSAYHATRKRRFLTFVLDAALEWITRYKSLSNSSEFAWYDMAVGMRAIRLAYLLDSAVRESSIKTDVIGVLLEAACQHAQVLSKDSMFAAHSNHGLYVAIGQAALSRRFTSIPQIAGGRQQAQGRLKEMIRSQFSEEAVHLEHSPDYHRMVSESVQRIVNARLLSDPELALFASRTQEVMASFILPNGRIAPFGDSPQRQLDCTGWIPLCDQLRFVVSGGSQGAAPNTGICAFPKSGYVIVRENTHRGSGDYADWSYLAQTCAFHSRVHKHADDLSFIWYDHGQDLLIDPGRYGYLGRTEINSELWQDGFWYSDPNRIYVESTRAHNTVEIDGRNFARRNTKPYGSALQRYGHATGVYYIESEVRHWTTLRHARLLLFRPAAWLIVFDWLWDNAQQEHEFHQRFHFAPELDVRRADKSVEIALNGTDKRLYMTSLLDLDLIEPVKGKRQTKMLGWVSRRDGEIIPCWTSGFMASATPRQTFATLFSFGEEPPRSTSDITQVARSGRRAQLSWNQNQKRHNLNWSRPISGPFRLEYQVMAIEESSEVDLH